MLCVIMLILTTINGHTHIKQMAQNIINGVSYPNQNTTHLHIEKSKQNENHREHINLHNFLKNKYNTRKWCHIKSKKLHLVTPLKNLYHIQKSKIETTSTLKFVLN